MDAGPPQLTDENTDFAKKTQDDVELGRRIRAIRTAKRLSLRVVSAGAGISEGFLSQVERGKASPSVASLRRICQALDEPMGSLFADSTGSEQDETLVRVADRRRVFRPDGSADYMVTPRGSRHLEIHHNIISPGRSSGPELYTHAGEEECILVLEGMLAVRRGARECVLSPGDSLLLDPKVGHGFMNPGTVPASVLWIISPANGDM
ncbi:cupin domain-containing protein [Arthrobacter sp. CAU 1506]|uniref:helix-turn-helix domain-containing protein n=1 Tax=Arthrobacter sp. CAU 1506 TaxID=2560052 RepID=UPI0010ACBB0C|nr:cupin domain-containing protein [Arthrobacter sp. CAU 1506]TJY66168.1 cupin domain-containing protein [Arthrobacter sp. CAU 1506]